MNALIQGSSARHTKLWMRAVWREGITPLLQMHDSLDLSVSSPEQAELVAQLGCDAVKLEVPMKVDVAYGRTWADATHTSDERNAAGPEKSTQPNEPEPSQQEVESEVENIVDGGEDIVDEAPITSDQVDWGAMLERDFPHAGSAFAEVETAPQQADLPPVANDPPTPPHTPRRDSGNGYGGNGRDDYSRGETEPPKSSPSETYIYKDEAGRFHMKVIRLAGKTAFPTYHWQNGDWVKGWPEKVVPYRLPELLAAPPSEPVWIPEGEKDANNVAALGLVATTNPGGAKQWQPELAQWFKGKELVFILEDNDAAGRGHTSKIIAASHGMVPEIVTVPFPELPTVQEVAMALNSLGVTPRDMMSIFQAMKQAGALQADLVIR